MEELHTCAWCGSTVHMGSESNRLPYFCTECHADFETEQHRSLHPMEERHPHDD